jgi:phage terminase large subunit-like protein
MSSLDLLSGLVLPDGRRWGEAAMAFQWEDAEAFFASSGPRFHFLTRPRGGSKTSDLAGFVAAWLVAEAGPGERAYAAAADRDQASLLIDAVRGFRDRSPVLSGLDVSAFSVLGPNGARLDALSADGASAWGLLPSLLVIDELAQWAETPGAKRFFDALTTGLGKVPGARAAIISTPGDPGSHWRSVWDFAEGSDLWRTSAVPGPVAWADPMFLAGERSRLTESLFRRLHMGEWTVPENALASLDDLRACVRLAGPQEPRDDARYVIGLDLGLVNDRTVAVVAHADQVVGAEPINDGEPGVPTWRDEDWQYQRMSNGMIVKHRQVRVARERAVPVASEVVLDRVERWQGTRERPVDIAAVESWVARMAAEFGGAHVLADPWQLAGSVREFLCIRGVG